MYDIFMSQVKSSQFIHQLSSKYSAYIDVVQPVEVAIYEIKLGVSLFTSSALENECLMKLNQNRENVLVWTAPAEIFIIFYFMFIVCNVFSGGYLFSNAVSKTI